MKANGDGGCGGGRDGPRGEESKGPRRIVAYVGGIDLTGREEVRTGGRKEGESCQQDMAMMDDNWSEARPPSASMHKLMRAQSGVE